MKALFFCLGLFSLTLHAAEPLNAVIGDEGYQAFYGAAPREQTPDLLRIHSHLVFVAHLLDQRRPMLSAEQSLRRAAGIRALYAYAAAGRYPINTDRPHTRAPVFIDHRGQVCAAGYLVERSAGRAAAEAIDRRHHHHLVTDMQGLDGWLQAQGFTLREVAMIQPTYNWRPQPPVAPWPTPVVPDQWTLVNTAGDELAKIQASRIYPFSDGLAAFKSNGKWGFIDLQGDVVIPAQFDRAEPFSDGLAVVRPLAIIDKTGKKRPVPKGIEELSSFVGGFAAAKKKGAWGFIDPEGQWRVPPKFKDVGLFSDGHAAAQNAKGWGYLDAKGAWVIQPRGTIQEAGAFHRGIAPVKVAGGWRLLNTQGDFTGKTWQHLGAFEDGVAPCKGEGGFGVIDVQGKILVAPDFSMIGDFSGGLAPAQKADWERIGYIDRTGKFVIGEQFNEAGSFKDGVASIRKESNWGCIDRKGRYVHQPRYPHRVIFSEGRGFVPVRMQVPPPRPVPFPGPRPRPQPGPIPGPVG